MNSRTFIKNGFFCTLTRDLGESYEQFMERGFLVISQKPTNLRDLEKYITYSRIMNNIKVHKCTYDKDIHLLIETMEKNL